MPHERSPTHAARQFHSGGQAGDPGSSPEADLESPAGYKLFSLTENGRLAGERTLDELPAETQDLIRELFDWVTTKTFPQLVTAVYDLYPEMAVNSAFQERPGDNLHKSSTSD